MESRNTTRLRLVALAVLTALLAGLSGAGSANAAAAFNPVLSAWLGEDAARAATALNLRIDQADGEEQIGALSITLPRDPGFTVDTDLPGNGGQVGTVHAVLHTNPRPATITIDGTLTDDNDRAGCVAGVRQCVIAHLDVAGVQVDAQLEIWENVAGTYRVAADLTSTWASDEATTPDLRLKELSASLVARVGPHTVVRNPASAGTWPLAYSFTSASVPHRGLTGGLHPACGPSCDVPLTTKEYAPSVPNQILPAHDSAHLSTQPIDFVWLPSTDRNEDPVTYTLAVQGQGPIATSATNALVTLPPGIHTWRVSAHAGGDTVSSGDGRVIVIDPDASEVYRFTSVTNGDQLYVDPVQHVFVYRQANGAISGAVSPTATVDRGYIAFRGVFTLAAAYDSTLGSAGGLFAYGNARREFADPPGP